MRYNLIFDEFIDLRKDEIYRASKLKYERKNRI
jgi:hypothetical protein